MASISSLTGSTSSSSSIYGNRNYNIISGLASGMDTESLISGAVQGYQQKIQSLQQKNTKLQWQQEAIQSVSDKLVEFARNYTSYAYSTSNLMSSSFFNNAVKTTANGIYAAMVTASGKSSSEVVINSIKQLATTARYAVSGSDLTGGIHVDSDNKKLTASGSEALDLGGEMKLSKLAGSLSLTYGSKEITIDFDELDLYADESGNLDEKALQSAIEEKLSKQKISTSSGTSYAADTRIGVSVSNGGQISFYDKTGSNTVSISGATGSLAGMIDGLSSVVSSKAGTFHLTSTDVVDETTNAAYLSGKSLTFSLDGKEKTIQLGTVSTNGDELVSQLNEELRKAFGTDTDGVNKVNASLVDGKLSFTVAEGSALSVTPENEAVGNALGIGSSLTSYVDTGKTLGDMGGLGWDWTDTTKAIKGVGTPIEQKNDEGDITGYVDEEGNRVNKDGYLVDEDDNLLFDLEINGVTIGRYSKDTEFNTVLNDINGNTEAGVKVDYSKTTGQFVFSAKDSGAGGRIEITGGLGAALFGTVDPDQPSSSYTPGKDAELEVTINGDKMTLSRSSNSFDLDGMAVTLNGTFTAADDTENITFTSKCDSDTIVDAVKKMVEDLNTIIKEVKSAYSDMPLEKSDGSSYEPLTDDDMADMSDSAIEAYEEKAKTGILFMDSDLSSLYSDLVNAITSSGADGVTLRSIGIDTSYSDGLTTLTLDEQKLREALDSDPDKVQEAFTKSKDTGAATNGLMASLQSITDRYAATTGDTKGILIEKAGSKYSPSSALDNTLLKQMEDVEEEISKWQDKMSDQVDYYTNKYTQLEMLINEMNSQSSALSGLLGG